MTKGTRAAAVDVSALVAEQSQYEAWLAALDARKEATAPHVFERVHADYLSRLEQVRRQLLEHREELEEQVATLAARVAKLEADAQVRRDERAELELRFAVGELSEAEFGALARECDTAIAGLTAEAASARKELARAHDALGGTHEIAAPASAADSSATQVPSIAPTPTPTPTPTRSPAPASRGSAFDELAFLSAVVSDVVSPAAEPSPGPSATPSPVSGAADMRGEPSPSAGVADQSAEAAAEPGAGPLNEFLADPLSSRTERASMAVWEREDGSGAFEAGNPAEPTAAPRTTGERNSGALAANVTGNNPIVLRPSGPVEQHKTLKCLECGSMNYPTEWYCERCGSELATL